MDSELSPSQLHPKCILIVHLEQFLLETTGSQKNSFWKTSESRESQELAGSPGNNNSGPEDLVSIIVCISPCTWIVRELHPGSPGWLSGHCIVSSATLFEVDPAKTGGHTWGLASWRLILWLQQDADLCIHGAVQNAAAPAHRIALSSKVVKMGKNVVLLDCNWT